MSLELIAEFDPFLAKHIADHGNIGRGKTNYLSSTICEEFITLMADKVLKTILDEVMVAKYFAIIVDSTPDVSHVDQLTFVVRYIQVDGEPIERFLKFIPSVGHKAQEMADSVVKTITNFGINIQNCRGQSYDNANNMSGIYNGLQAKILNLSPLAQYVPCAAHSLNLVGECAAESCEEACSFFGLLQEIYNFFTASTTRWEVLQLEVQKKDLRKQSHTIKSLSTTRWSARADACLALSESWAEIINALLFIEDDDNQKPICKCEARGIRIKLQRLETAFMAVFWGFLLNRLNITNKKLQSVNIDIFTVVQLYDSLIELVTDSRDKFNEFESKAKILSEIQEYEKDTRRIKKRKIQPGESAAGEVELDGRDKMRVSTFLVVLDNLKSELKRRRDAYEKFHEKFSFLTKLTSMTSDEVELKAKNLLKTHPQDLEENFVDECLHFRAHCNILKDKWKSALEILKWIRKEDIQTVYPNVEIALRMCVCAPVTNCSGERSFSWLRRAKNFLRSKMTEDRLNSLAILNIESRLLRSLDYDDIIDEFARKKSRRRLL